MEIRIQDSVRLNNPKILIEIEVRIHDGAAKENVSLSILGGASYQTFEANEWNDVVHAVETLQNGVRAMTKHICMVRVE